MAALQLRHEPVQSSNVHSVAYDEAHQVLEVQFRGGGVYQYVYVPKHVYDGLMSAPSVGKYMHQVVKPNYGFRKVATRPSDATSG